MNAFEKTKQLLGSYVGEWSLFGVDGNGQPVLIHKWTDNLEVITVEDLGDRVAAAGVDRLDFGKFQGMVTFREGYLKLPDGGCGQRFMEVGGQMIMQTEVSPGVLVYPVSLADAELKSMGLDASKQQCLQHLGVRVVDGDREFVTRLTFIVGGDRTQQSESGSGSESITVVTTLKGYHRRLEAPPCADLE